MLELFRWVDLNRLTSNHSRDMSAQSFLDVAEVGSYYKFTRKSTQQFTEQIDNGIIGTLNCVADLPQLSPPSSAFQPFPALGQVSRCLAPVELKAENRKIVEDAQKQKYSPSKAKGKGPKSNILACPIDYRSSPGSYTTFEVLDENNEMHKVSIMHSVQYAM